MSFLFVPTPQLVAKEDALPGRAEPILEPKPHAVLGTPITGPWKEGQRSLLVALGFSVDSRGSNSGKALKSRVRLCILPRKPSLSPDGRGEFRQLLIEQLFDALRFRHIREMDRAVIAADG